VPHKYQDCLHSGSEQSVFAVRVYFRRPSCLCFRRLLHPQI